MTLDIQDITIRARSIDIIVDVTLRPDVLSSFQEFTGCGDTLSEALLDLSDQLCEEGL